MIWMILSIIIGLIVRFALIHISVTAVDIRDVTLKKTFLVALVSQIVSLMFGEYLLLGVMFMTIIIMVLVKFIYLTPWIKAFVATIFYFVARCLIWVALDLIGLASNTVSLP